MKHRKADLEVSRPSRLSALVLIRPATRRGRAWVDERLHVEPWQRLGAWISVDLRSYPEILAGAAGDGLRVGRIEA